MTPITFIGDPELESDHVEIGKNREEYSKNCEYYRDFLFSEKEEERNWNCRVGEYCGHRLIQIKPYNGLGFHPFGKRSSSPFLFREPGHDNPICIRTPKVRKDFWEVFP